MELRGLFDRFIDFGIDDWQRGNLYIALQEVLRCLNDSWFSSGFWGENLIVR